MIPAYQFNCLGGVVEWRALVSLPQNVSGNIEFQALRPVTNADDGVYEMVYHNIYRMENINGSVVTLPVNENDGDNSIIPVDITSRVGIYVNKSKNVFK